MTLKFIDVSDIPRFFETKRIGKKYSIKVGRARPVVLTLPFALDAHMARVCGMMPDGTMSKSLSHISFTQKKDLNKPREFGSIIARRFGVKPRYRECDGALTVTIGSVSLCNFLHHCMDAYKCDQSARVPDWIKDSDETIVKEYLRYAFAMEGSVSDSAKGDKEIKFHSCDRNFLVDISKVLKNRFDIASHIYAYYVKGYGEKYYLSIFGRENITGFYGIGFALESHQKRLCSLVNSYKPAAWEVALSIIKRFGNREFGVRDVHKELPHICRRAAHQRVMDLVNLGFVKRKGMRYSITEAGMARGVPSNIDGGLMLRTNPKTNEKLVLKFLQDRHACISDISRALGIHAKTTKDVLRRLEKRGEVRLEEVDRFQRKIYGKADSGGSPAA